jgi:putative transposase
VAFPLSYRQLEELMQERGVSVDHSSINRSVLKYSQHLEAALHRCKRPVRIGWRMNETYIRVRGPWRYLYRAVDKTAKPKEQMVTEEGEPRLTPAEQFNTVAA